MGKKKVILVYGSIPKDSGTFTFYKNLSQGLLGCGVEMLCVTIGQQEHKYWQDEFADDGCILLVPDESDVKKQAQSFVRWCMAQKVDIVMPMNSVVMLSVIPHLGPQTRIVTRCANAFELGYRITVGYEEYLTRVVATTPCHVKDLVEKYGAYSSKIELIPHGINPAPFNETVVSSRGEQRRIKLAFLGRLEHNQKGILFIPKIIHCLKQKGVPFELNIAGSGVHEQVLKNQMVSEIAAGTVKFVGRILPSEVPNFLAKADVFLFPSRFEGFGFTLIEAMMAGCVPVASRLEGITDFILDDGRTGFLCPVGDITAFVNAIVNLYENRDLLCRMSKATAAEARRRFTQERMVADYAKMLMNVMKSPPVATPPRPWSEFKIHPAFRRTWRDWIPKPLKRLARKALYHACLSDRYT